MSSSDTDVGPENLSPELAAIITALRDAPRPEGGDVAQLRAMAEQIGLMFPPPEEVEIAEVDLGRAGALLMRPPSVDERLAVLYVHGGGFVSGSARAFAGIPARIARGSGAVALSVDYRLAPEHPFPAAIDDALAGWDWLVDSGLMPADIAVCGDSAGAAIALGLVLRLRDEGRGLPGCVIGLSPWLDLTCPEPTETVDDPLVDLTVLRDGAAAYAQSGLDNPYASPAAAQLEGLPPLLLQIGRGEVLRPAAEAFAARASAAGVDVELECVDGVVHVWHLFAGVPEAEVAMGRVVQRIRDLH